MKLAAIAVAGLLLAALIGAGAWLYAPDKPRAELEARYARPPSRFVQAAGARLHVRDTGPRDAPAVLLLHGFGASLHTWEDWARLLEADFRVVRLDLPGFGLTGPDPTGDYTDARTVEVLSALMDELGIRRAAVVGSSMGGRIAWFFAAAAPERVEKLALMAPDGFAGPGREYGKAPRVPLLARLLPYVLPDRLLRPMLARAYGDPSVLAEAVYARYRDMLLAPGVRRAILARVGQSVLLEPEPLLRRISVPTLLVWGEKDALVPFRNAADYAEVLPDSATVSFPELGHVPHEEAPARSLAPVRAFLERRGREAAPPASAERRSDIESH
ncbi:MAG: alpha/beta fold hydrolase [Acetobacteraceae bacterium]|nr:alpha/beta fold hydrolase [Acetobacteraceae bacterium]